MDNKTNVINIGSYWVKQSSATEGDREQDSHGPGGQIVGFQEFTEKKIDFDRRKVRRTILSEFLGAFVVIPQVGLQEVTVYDVSTEGMSFDFAPKDGQFKIGLEMSMRFYLSQTNYFSFNVQITNARFLESEGTYRYGSRILRDDQNHEAIEHFTKFIESVSQILRVDKGDLRAPGTRR